MSIDSSSISSESLPGTPVVAEDVRLCVHDESAIAAKDPLTDCDASCRRIFAINVTGAIGAGKSLAMQNTKAHFDANPQYGIKCVLVDEGADEEKFAWWLDAYINGLPRDDGGPNTKVTCGVFQMAITTLIRGPKRAAGRAAARALAADAAGDAHTVVILMERAREDAWRIFMPANRAMLTDTADLAIFDAESELWHANAVDVGEPLPDATILLTTKAETAMERMGARGRKAEEGYTDSYPYKVWRLYDSARNDWHGGPTKVVDAEAEPLTVCIDIATAVKELVKE